MAKKTRPKSVVLVKGEKRVTFNLAHRYLAFVAPDICTITPFDKLKKLSPMGFYRLYIRLGYQRESNQGGWGT